MHSEQHSTLSEFLGSTRSSAFTKPARKPANNETQHSVRVVLASLSACTYLPRIRFDRFEPHGEWGNIRVSLTSDHNSSIIASIIFNARQDS
jgi:hypothetical protein